MQLSQSGPVECWDPGLPDRLGIATDASSNINAARLLKASRDAAIAALRREGRRVRQIGILWLQGQNDASVASAATGYGAAGPHVRRVAPPRRRRR